MNEAKAKPGRNKGWRKTSKREDSNILQTFKRLRPDGHGVDSRIIHTNLPRQLRRKVCRRTVRRRLAEKDFVPRKKIAKTDTGPKQCRYGYLAHHLHTNLSTPYNILVAYQPIYPPNNLHPLTCLPVHIPTYRPTYSSIDFLIVHFPSFPPSEL